MQVAQKVNNELFSNNCYKNKYFISFYDELDENFVISFDNLKQICMYKGKELSVPNLTLISVELYRALKRPDHSTRMLDGTLMHVHLIDIEEIDENDE